MGLPEILVLLVILSIVLLIGWGIVTFVRWRIRRYRLRTDAMESLKAQSPLRDRSRLPE
jgi:Tfp pilus assembly protein FimT